MKRSLLLGASLLLMTTSLLARWGRLQDAWGWEDELSDTKISSGLKQALQIGAEQSVKLTGRPNGYFGNPDIKILMPSNLRTLEKGLRMVGYGPKVDDFVLSMNRAAEAAAPAARKIFIDAITAMTFDDARRILSGGDTAATDYFKDKTTPQLTAAFRPVVERTMAKNGVTQQYEAWFRNTSRFHSPRIRIWTSATTWCPRLSMDSFSNWARKKERFAKIRRHRPPTCSGKYSAGDRRSQSIARQYIVLEIPGEAFVRVLSTVIPSNLGARDARAKIVEGPGFLPAQRRFQVHQEPRSRPCPHRASAARDGARDDSEWGWLQKAASQETLLNKRPHAKALAATVLVVPKPWHRIGHVISNLLYFPASRSVAYWK